MRNPTFIALLLLAACIETPASSPDEPTPMQQPGGNPDPSPDPMQPDPGQPDPDEPASVEPAPVAELPCDGEWRIDSFSATRINQMLYFKVEGQACSGETFDYLRFPFFDQDDQTIAGRCREDAVEATDSAGGFRATSVIGGCSQHPNAQRATLKATFDGPVLAEAEIQEPIIVERGAACGAFDGRLCTLEDDCGTDGICRAPQPPTLAQVQAELSTRTGAFNVAATVSDINADHAGFAVHFKGAEGELLGEINLSASVYSRAVNLSLSAGDRLPPQIDPMRIATFELFAVDFRGQRSAPASVEPTSLPELDRGAACTNLEGQCAPGLVCDNQTRQCVDATRCAAEYLPRTRSLLDQEFTVEKDESETWAVDLPPGLWRLSARVWGNERPDVPMTLAAVASCDVFAFRHAWMMFVNTHESLIRLTTPETIYLQVTRHHGADRYDLSIEAAE